MRAIRVYAAVAALRSAGRRTARAYCSPFRLPVSMVGCDDCACGHLVHKCRPRNHDEVPNVPSTYFGNETKACSARYRSMKRLETTANEHWTVKAIFAFALGAEIALFSGLPVLPSNWP